jgi:hypothetical protein
MWEVYGPKVKNIKLNVTESGNGTPDFLNETRWNVERMLKMQDEDGGARHKQTSERFPGFVMPDDDHLPSEVIGTEQESLERCGCELRDGTTGGELLAPDPTFVESAQDDLYYLLGAEYIFTFVDDASWDESLPHPRHRPSGADKNAEP